MRMPNNFKNMNFSGNSFYIIDIFYLPFIQYLDSYLLAGVNMESLFNFAKCSLSECFFYFVIADHFVSFFHMNVNLFFFWHQNFCYSTTFVDIFNFSIAVRLNKFRTCSFLWCLLLIIIYSQVITFFNFLFFFLLINFQILKQEEHILWISWFNLRHLLLNSLIAVFKSLMKKLIIRFVIVCILNSIFVRHLFFH